MRENERICNVLNELTVEEFLETYSESIQNRMAELGYYVKDGLICIDQEERMDKVFEKIIEHLENASFWTDSSFDEDGYSNADSEEVVCLHEAIEIGKQEADQYNVLYSNNRKGN